MQPVTAYFVNLACGIALLAVFFFIYCRFTPYDEIALIRKGNRAAARSLGGAMLGFCLTLYSSILHNDTLLVSIAWAAGGMAVQLALYLLIAHTIARVDQSIVDDNEAMGTFLGALSVAVGLINAACMS